MTDQYFRGLVIYFSFQRFREKTIGHSLSYQTCQCPFALFRLLQLHPRLSEIFSSFIYQAPSANLLFIGSACKWYSKTEGIRNVCNLVPFINKFGNSIILSSLCDFQSIQLFSHGLYRKIPSTAYLH